MLNGPELHVYWDPRDCDWVVETWGMYQSFKVSSSDFETAMLLAVNKLLHDSKSKERFEELQGIK